MSRASCKALNEKINNPIPAVNYLYQIITLLLHLKLLSKTTNMKAIWLSLLACLFFSVLNAQERTERPVRINIPLDSIVLSDPFILADRKTSRYYMTGTGGMLWKSKDLKFWDGPY